jgi:hypothetical protein
MWGFETHKSALCCNYEGRQHFEVATIRYIPSLPAFLNLHSALFGHRSFNFHSNANDKEYINLKLSYFAHAIH